MANFLVTNDIVSIRILFIILPIIMGIVHCIWKRRTPGFSKTECFLAYFLIIGVGLQSLLVGYLEIYHSDVVAAYIGSSDTLFLSELGKANMAFGILGILSFWFRGGWRGATALGYGLFLFMTAIGHYRYFILNHHTHQEMIGIFIAMNILLAVCLFILLILRRT
ncbi:MAG: DUF6790 family protein [Rhabdochlamydiaceae bacterium]